MSDGARCHYCRKVPCVCHSIPRPTRADAGFLATDPCEPLQNLAQGYLALLDENEALAKALEYLIQKIDDSDGIDTDRLEQCRAVLAEYAKRKQEGGS